RFLVNDVGEETWEEVDELRRGGDYGWPDCEGACEAAGKTNPVYQYHHFRVNGIEADAITGGVFYHGPQLPTLQLAYFFAAFARGYGWLLPPGDRHRALTLTPTAHGAVGLAGGPDGALYYASITTGAVYALNFNVPRA